MTGRKGSARQDIETTLAIESAQKVLDDNTVTLSTGVVLRGKQANPTMLIQVMTAFPRPEPPMVFMPTFGREMENPDDPDYADRLQAWNMSRAGRMLDTLICLGTDLVSVPKGMKGPGNDDWLADYTLLGLPISPDHSTWRYLTWVKFKAAVTDDDLKKIQELVGRLSGIRESAVKSAENFPGGDPKTG